MDYKQAGVDIELGRDFVSGIRQKVESTYRPGVLGNLGGFSGCFQLPSGYEEPVLVSGTDGVGTKLKIAQELRRHDTVGIDLVAMCVNDVLTSGAEPLFFLDYIATGKLNPAQLTQVVEGIAEGCLQSGCALLGGETAEMPGFYQSGEYDLAGFCVGMVEKRKILDGSQVQVGDMAVGLASSGVHSNGFSLVRKIVADSGLSWDATPEVFNGASLGEVFLSPTRIYVKSVLAARRSPINIHGMAHITGGGIPENLPRCLNQKQSVQIYPHSWSIPPVFKWLAQTGNISNKTMFETFNMGIGFVVIVAPEDAESTVTYFDAHGIQAFLIGEVIDGRGEITINYEDA